LPDSGVWDTTLTGAVTGAGASASCTTIIGGGTGDVACTSAALSCSILSAWADVKAFASQSPMFALNNSLIRKQGFVTISLLTDILV
jgi:hypothetical protein